MQPGMRQFAHARRQRVAAGMHLFAHRFVGQVHHEFAGAQDVGGSALFGSNDYNQSYFGVTANQSATSGYTKYTPGSGLYAVKAAITWTHRFDDNWSLLAATEATRYMKKAGDSPIVKARTNYGTMAAVNYTF
jgi:outer membrane scaffolding protein for murein synthesis (MipA/OmpV family)